MVRINNATFIQIQQAMVLINYSTLETQVTMFLTNYAAFIEYPYKT